MHEIVRDRRSKYHIVGANLSDSTERYAASELQKYIYESTSALVPYFSDRCERRGAEIIIGYKTRTAASHVSMEELNSLGDDGFIIRSIGEDILITGKTSRGTLYGVYELLSRYLGFRAFTREVERIDKVSELILPELSIRETPDFEYRDAYFRFAFDGAFSAKNRLNSTLGDISSEKGGSFKFFNCHHAYDDLVPPSKYFGEHPEYFSEIGGVRSPRQLCTSNEDTIRIATETVRGWILANPECKVFSVAQNDNSDYCTCERCRALDDAEGSPAASVITFANRIYENLKDEHPEVLLHTFAYMHSRRAPRTVRPHKNVIVRLCDFECQWGDPLEVIAAREPESVSAAFLSDLADWSRITPRLYIWDYAVNFRNYPMPFPIFYTVAENIRLFKRYGIKGVLEQGNFSYGGGAALDELKSYLIARLLWNAECDVDLIIDEFLDGVFGKGAPYIRQYINETVEATRGHFMRIYDYSDAEYLTDELISHWDELFSLAEASESGETRRRIEREHLSVKYMMVTRIEDDELRARKVDAFEEEIRAHRLTEVMERTNLDDSFDYMRRSRYARERDGRYSMYYIVR